VEVVGPVHVVAVGRDALQDLEVDKILSKVDHHMEGLTHGIDETIIDQIPL